MVVYLLSRVIIAHIARQTIPNASNATIRSSIHAEFMVASSGSYSSPLWISRQSGQYG
jgi:hypothetical protein